MTPTLRRLADRLVGLLRGCLATRAPPAAVVRVVLV
jgi:hypothetical protein